MNARPSLLENQIKYPNHWIAFKPSGTKSYRDGIGAGITVRAGKRLLVDEVRSGSSYDSNSNMRVHFGLGTRTKLDSVEVRWPSGPTERFDNVLVDHINIVKEGSGIAVKKRPSEEAVRTSLGPLNDRDLAFLTSPPWFYVESTT